MTEGVWSIALVGGILYRGWVLGGAEMGIGIGD